MHVKIEKYQITLQFSYIKQWRMRVWFCFPNSSTMWNHFRCPVILLNQVDETLSRLQTDRERCQLLIQLWMNLSSVFVFSKTLDSAFFRAFRVRFLTDCWHFFVVSFILHAAGVFSFLHVNYIFQWHFVKIQKYT